MKKAYVFLAAGFEETEAIATIDILRRAGIDTITVSITNELTVQGAHGINIEADSTLMNTAFAGANALVLPGGMPGSTNLNECKPLRDLLQDHYNEGDLIAAICAAPLVLGSLGFLNNKKATCYPGCEELLTGAKITGEAVTKDGNIITGKGPGFVFDFALALVEAIEDKEKRDQVASDLLLA